MRNVFLTVLVAALFASQSSAQGWAEKMFKDGLTHDFGVVPHGAQLFHRFTITNIYAVRMEIIGLTSGCSCVSANAVKRVLEPRESTTIDINMDARRFTGPKSVAIRLTVGPEFTSSAELKVTANSRADIVFNPGEVQFDQVARGQALTKTVDVEYAGTLNWQIKEVKVAKELPLMVAVTDLYRRTGQVGYQLKVTLKPEAPVGPLKEYVYLVTNDPNAPMVPLLVEGNVLAPVTVAPGVLSLGEVKVGGDPLIRRVVVRGTRPFRITELEGQGEGIMLGAPLGTTSVTVQTVTLRCLFDKPGEFKRELKIKTDLPEGIATVVVEGNVKP
jgi:hypothetical protein